MLLVRKSGSALSTLAGRAVEQNKVKGRLGILPMLQMDDNIQNLVQGLGVELRYCYAPSCNLACPTRMWAQSGE